MDIAMAKIGPYRFCWYKYNKHRNHQLQISYIVYLFIPPHIDILVWQHVCQKNKIGCIVEDWTSGNEWKKGQYFCPFKV